MKNDTREPADNQEDEKPVARTKPRPPAPPGYYSNAIITRRNGGVPHRFLDSIGGCSANYR